MSNVSYDLDTSGGLMPLIRALIKPPDEETSTQKPKKPQHPYYKRPGKGHNHDSCDACGEGGDLICCDRCPASFHLGCYDPPLEESDIPAGLWLCRECRASDTEKPSSARGSRAQSPAESVERKTRSLRNNRSVSKKSNKDEEEDEKKEADELTPMEALVKAARVLNPKQFELPREMRIPCLFPGTEKEGSKNGNSSLVTVDASGCVPLPAKLCFVCQETCKAAPLLQCDYCPLLFHQDCLDPPLTALPTGRWMCPNHVEQFIDWKLVNSISATERVALWDKFTGPVDQHAIKIDFIRRARNPRPAFRLRVPAGVRGRVSVPGMVRRHYRRPPPLLPSRREYRRCAAVLESLRDCKDFDMAAELNSEEPPQPVCLNAWCPQSRGGPCPADRSLSASRPGTPPPETTPPVTPPPETDCMDTGANTPPPQSEDEASQKDEKHSASSSELSDSDFEYLTASVKKRRIEDEVPCLRLRDDQDVERLVGEVDRQLRQLDQRLVRLLAWQRLHQVACGERVGGEWSGAGVESEVAHVVRRSVAGVRLRARGARAPSALLGAADRRRIATAVWGAPPTPPAVPAPNISQTDTLVRALCTRLYRARNGSGETVGAPVAMRAACLAVGSDSRCGLRLDPRCRRAAPHHATLFWDEVTRHFELINYSEWGSEVNGVLYTCDVRRSDSQPDAASRRINRDLIVPLGDEGPCRCPSSGPVEGAWEGSALVPHGALLRFGCQDYVFSIADSLHHTGEDVI